MEYLTGVVLAALTCAMARIVGLDRDRGFYTAVAMVVATYYILFAVTSGHLEHLAMQSVIAMAFFAAAIYGFKRNLGWVAAALAAHAALDLGHLTFGLGSGEPAFWPGFCMAYDATAALVVARLATATPPTARSGTSPPSPAGNTRG